MLPTTQEYKISLMIGQDSFRTLEHIEVVPNPNYPDEPWYSTGGLAIVFKIKMGDKMYALKCFYNEANERQERLGLIADYLKQNPAPYFVDFTYLDNEIFVETANGGEGYPVVLMEWVEGKTLDNYLEEVCQQQNKPALQNLYFQFCNLAWWLQQQPIAHGDLKHDNLMVTPEGKLKMIDYDGMFVPALHGRKANEQGSQCYQHPKRDAHYFNERLDDFSLLILQITLLALQHEPSLFKAHYNGDGILLKDTDYPNFAQSPTKTLLWRLNDVKIPLLLSQLQTNLNYLSGIDLMPLLQDVEWINWLVGGQSSLKKQIAKSQLLSLIMRDCYPISVINFMAEQGYVYHETIIKYDKINEPFVTFSTADAHRKKIYFPKNNKRHLPKGNTITNNFIYFRIDTPLGQLENDTLKITFKWNKNWQYLFCELLFKYYKLSEVLLSKLIDTYNGKLDWLNWSELSSNLGLPWSLDLIKKYEDKWDFNELSKNSDLPWSVELIENYEGKWDFSRLSSNSGLPWSVELIENYEDRWRWLRGEGVLGLSGNSGLPWTMSLIEKYKDKWHWEVLSHNSDLPWSLDLIEKYEDKWEFSGLSSNSGLPWNLDLIRQYEDKWDFSRLGGNSGLTWTLELIEKYENKWGWFQLSSNSGLPWTLELIEKYKNKWETKFLSNTLWGHYGLSGNSGLPWTIELIKKYADKWSFDGLGRNSGLPWTLELIEEYKGKWGWSYLSMNSRLPWSLDLIEKYKDEWDWYSLNNNKGVYEKIFHPLLNDDFIEEIMEEITKINP